MAFDLASITQGRVNRPKIILLYGVPGIGKTTAASKMPNPIFLPTEDGQDELDVAKFPLIKSYEDMMTALTSVANGETEFKTLVVDSMSSLEMIIEAKVCNDSNVTQISKIPYGRGRDLVMEYWEKFFNAVSWIRDNKGMQVVLIAHPEITKTPNPDGESYDSYTPLLSKKALEMFKQKCNAIFFANYKVFVRSVEKGFGQKEHKAVGSGERVMFTTTRPTYIAKNQAQPSLPDEMPFDLNLALDYWYNPEKYQQ